MSGHIVGSLQNSCKMNEWFNNNIIMHRFFKIVFKLYFMLEYSWLTNNIVIVLGTQQRTQLYIYMYPFYHRLPSHPGCSIILSRVPWLYSRSLLVIHFKYSSVYMPVTNSLTIPPILPLWEAMHRYFKSKDPLSWISCSHPELHSQWFIFVK